jgi:topoisomerase IA-like protein
MDKICIDKNIQIGIFRELQKRDLITKIQLDKAIEIIVKKEAKKGETDTGSGLLPG